MVSLASDAARDKFMLDRNNLKNIRLEHICGLMKTNLKLTKGENHAKGLSEARQKEIL